MFCFLRFGNTFIHTHIKFKWCNSTIHIWYVNCGLSCCCCCSMVVWSQQQQQYRLSCCASMNVAMWQIWFLSSSNTYQKYSPIMISHIFFANHSSIHPWFLPLFLALIHSFCSIDMSITHTHTQINKKKIWNETKRNDRHWERRKSPKFFLLILQQQIIVIIIIINDFGLRINFLFPFIHSFIHSLVCVCVHFLRKKKTYKYTHSTSLKKEYLHIYDRLQGVIYLFISIFFWLQVFMLEFQFFEPCLLLLLLSFFFFHFSNIKYHYY